MRAADRDPARGERPMELTAISRLMISRKRGPRRNSLQPQTKTNKGETLSYLSGKIRLPKAIQYMKSKNEGARGTDLPVIQLRRSRWRSEK
jgi:hypothetical protein